MIGGFFVAGFLLATTAMLVVAGTTLAWMIDSWRTPRAVGQMPFPEPDAPQLSFSLIVPARHEEAVLADTVRRLLCQDHPFVEVLVVVGDDDPGTAAVAHELAEQDPRVVVIVDDSVPKNKPKALNRALAACTGEITGVFDAEDEVAPALLTHVDACFRAEGAHVVQGGVQLMNYRSNWWSLRNTLEYFFWFASRLHSKGGRSLALTLSRFNLPIMAVNAITQMLVPPPKYTVDRLVPCRLGSSTRVSELFIIERGAPRITDLDRVSTLERMIENTDDAYGFPPFRYLAPAITMAGHGYQELRQREREILASFLCHVNTRVVASDNFGWADEIPRLLRRNDPATAPHVPQRRRPDAVNWPQWDDKRLAAQGGPA